ncbi:AMP-binding protein, partial [Mycobacterium tuberculosis]|nr:AMP-binding protein [Mycobacterium tuberculosis]
HHRSWTESFRHDAIEFAIGVDDVVLAPGTLTHSLFLYALMHGLHAGARVVLCRRFRPDAVVRLIAEEQASVLYGVPTQFQLIAEA